MITHTLSSRISIDAINYNKNPNGIIIFIGRSELLLFLHRKNTCVHKKKKKHSQLS